MCFSRRCRLLGSGRWVRPVSQCRWSCKSSSRRLSLSWLDGTDPGDTKWIIIDLFNTHHQCWIFIHVMRDDPGCSYLQAVLQHAAGPDGDPEPLQGPHNSLNYMRWRLEYVGPHVVKQVVKGVFAAKTINTQRHVLDHCTGSLSVDQVSAGWQEQGQGSTVTGVTKLEMNAASNYVYFSKSSKLRISVFLWPLSRLSHNGAVGSVVG